MVNGQMSKVNREKDTMRYQESIDTLKKLFTQMGFADGLEALLYNKLCFQLPQVVLTSQVPMADDVLRFSILLELKEENYAALYYDAQLLKPVAIPIIDGAADCSSLEAQLSTIDWHTRDPYSLQDCKTIDSIVSLLSDLSFSEEGLTIAPLLRYKYFRTTEHATPDLSSYKTLYEVQQRFYFFPGTAPIGIQDAYRFLSNKFMERQFAAGKRMQRDILPGGKKQKRKS